MTFARFFVGVLIALLIAGNSARLVHNFRRGDSYGAMFRAIMVAGGASLLAWWLQP